MFGLTGLVLPIVFRLQLLNLIHPWVNQRDLIQIEFMHMKFGLILGIPVHQILIRETFLLQI